MYTSSGAVPSETSGGVSSGTEPSSSFSPFSGSAGAGGASCGAADHYPYLLSDTDTDYYNELRGVTDSERDTSRYRNALILWCGSMDEPVQVDEPCSAVDIVPTLSNLFGLTYDSRLLSGRDILDKSYNASSAAGSIPLVILPTAGGNSWATAAGIYEASPRT